MQSLFLGIYLVPAVVIGLCIWLGLAALRNFGFGVRGRRIGFVALATTLLAPSIAPAGISIAYVPNGVLVALGGLPMLHQQQLVRFAVLSFLITAIISFGLSYFLIRESDIQEEADSRRVIAGVAQVTAVFAVFILFRATLPDREIPGSIDWTLIESVYGEDLDAVEALTLIDDLAQWQSEVTRLDGLIESDSSIVSLMTADESFERFQEGRQLFIGTPSTGGGCSSTGGRWNNDQMMRCTRQIANAGRTETLLYRRITDLDGNRTYIDVEFDYDELARKFDAAAIHRATAGSEQLAQRQDDALLGRWSIDERYERTINEERFQTGELVIGPRLSFGTYAIQARADVESTLRSETSRFDRQVCRGSSESCKFEEETTGTLRVRGSKIQIIYKDAKWGTDILRLSTDTMLGRNNMWGSTTRLERDERSPQ